MKRDSPRLSCSDGFLSSSSFRPSSPGSGLQPRLRPPASPSLVPSHTRLRNRTHQHSFRCFPSQSPTLEMTATRFVSVCVSEVVWCVFVSCFLFFCSACYFQPISLITRGHLERTAGLWRRRAAACPQLFALDNAGSVGTSGLELWLRQNGNLNGCDYQI